MASITRVIAACSRFFTLIQSGRFPGSIINQSLEAVRAGGLEGGPDPIFALFERGELCGRVRLLSLGTRTDRQVEENDYPIDRSDVDARNHVSLHRLIHLAALAADSIKGIVALGRAPVAKSTVTLWEATAGAPRQLAQVKSFDDGRFEVRAEGARAGGLLYLVAAGGVAKASNEGRENPDMVLWQQAAAGSGGHTTILAVANG